MLINSMFKFFDPKAWFNPLPELDTLPELNPLPELDTLPELNPLPELVEGNGGFDKRSTI